MKARPFVVAATLIAIILSGTAFGHAKVDGPAKLTLCSDSHRSGHRIVSNLEIVGFYVPLVAKMKKVADVDYVGPIPASARQIVAEIHVWTVRWWTFAS